MNSFASEMMSSSAFQKLIEQLRQRYDWILAVTNAPVCSVDTEILLPLFPYVAVTLRQANVKEINVYTRFLKQNPNRKITFILDEGR